MSRALDRGRDRRGDRRRASMAISRSRGVAFDSREVGPGDLFVALKGEATDGHRFVDQAFAAGAAGAMVERGDRRIRMSASPTRRAALERSRPRRRARAATARIVGVTGSVGKTGTKEALFAALDRCAPGRAHRSVKSYNNHTGVPLSLARMPRDARVRRVRDGDEPSRASSPR